MLRRGHAKAAKIDRRVVNLRHSFPMRRDEVFLYGTFALCVQLPLEASTWSMTSAAPPPKLTHAVTGDRVADVCSFSR